MVKPRRKITPRTKQIRPIRRTKPYLHGFYRELRNPKLAVDHILQAASTADTESLYLAVQDVIAALAIDSEKMLPTPLGRMPKTYQGLCRMLLPRRIRARKKYLRMLSIADVMAGQLMTRDQNDYFGLLRRVIEDYEQRMLMATRPVRVIKTKADYEGALKRIEKLMDASPKTQRGEELELLSLVHDYEEREFPIGKVSSPQKIGTGQDPAQALAETTYSSNEAAARQQDFRLGREGMAHLIEAQKHLRAARLEMESFLAALDFNPSIHEQ